MEFLVLVRYGIVIWSFLHINLTAGTRLPAVKITEIVARSQSEIHVAWQPSFQVKKGKLRYVIRYKAKGAAHARSSTGKQELTLTGLTPETTYIVAVRAVKRRARGDWSKSVQAITKPKELTETDVEGNITIGEVGVNTAHISWELNNSEHVMQSSNGFRVVWKSREDKEEAETTDSNLTMPGLQPDTRYSASVYLLRKTGGKIKLGAVKFQTEDEPIRAPRKLRIKNVTDKKIVVKWRHLRASSDQSTITQYVVKYKRRGAEPPEVCQIHVANTTKAKAIYGVLPDAKYSVRVAGQFDNETGPYTEWVKVRTLAFNRSASEVRTYHISPEEVLLAWEPFLEDAEIKIDVYTDLDTLSLSLVSQLAVPSGRHVVLERLVPGTWYRTIVRQKAGATCPIYRQAEFKTNSVSSVEASYLESRGSEGRLDLRDYDPYLRLLPLPTGRHMVTWSPAISFHDNVTYIYVVRILGEPFLYHLSTDVIPLGRAYHVIDNLGVQKTYSISLSEFDSHSEPFLYHLSTDVIPLGRAYHVIDDLDVQKTYSISLSVFDSRSEYAVFVSKHLLVLPADDVSGGDDGTSLADLYGNSWPVNSMDIVTKDANLTQLQKDILNDNISVEQIVDSDWWLISKRYPDEVLTLDDNDEEDNTTDSTQFAQQAPPTVDPIADINVQEGQSVDVTCWSHGDPYPIMAWINKTTDQSLQDVGNETSDRRISVSRENYLGSGTYSDNKAYLGRKRFLAIQPIELWDAGQYACVAENPSGRNESLFSINVTPKPPGPVRNLTSTSETPFDISVVWRPPEQGIQFLTGYHVTLLDEYGVTLQEANVTDTDMIFSSLDPNTPYKILVSGLNEWAAGEAAVTVLKTERIPVLGPPHSVTVDTVNSTTLQVSWQPPRVVQSRQVRLRTYLFYHRRAGSRKAEEMQLHRNFTHISIIDLEPEEHYKVQVVAMSEDGQVSYSDWLNGSTYRDAYMDESRPPPPPRNVFLRPEADNVIVSWLPPTPDENILVRGYSIEVLHNGTRREVMTVDYKESSVIVYEVEMGVVYQISVRSKNKAGQSVDQWEEIYIPEVYVTKFPVQEFRGHALSASTLELLWDPPQSGAFTHFVLSYTITGSDVRTLPGGGNLPDNVRNYVVRSLRPYTLYKFVITPYLKRMKGESANTTVRTYSDKPTHAPSNVSLTPVNATAVLISCDPPGAGKNGEIITYKVSFRTKHTWRNDVIVNAEETEDLNYYVTELLPSTVYEFRVRAMTVNGSGPWSSWHQTRTPAPEPILPKVPRELKTTSTLDTITLSWQPPDQNIEHIAGYIVGYGRFIPEVYRYSTTKDTSSYTLTALDSGSVYIVSVRSFNDHGESVAAFELASTTKPKRG